MNTQIRVKRSDTSIVYKCINRHIYIYIYIYTYHVSRNPKLPQAQLIQQQSLELTTLRDGLELQMQRHCAAATRLAEAEEKLEEAQCFGCSL